MTGISERVEIIVTDRVSTGPAKKLRDVAAGAREAGHEITVLKSRLATLDSKELNALSLAASRAAAAQAKLVTANARQTTATAQASAATARAEVTQQKLATEMQRTVAAAERAAAAQARARTATLAEEKASIALTHAKQREAAARTAANNATARTATVGLSASRAMRQQNAQTTNLVHQFNDIGVSLASGQNPLLVAIQQGSQISTVFGPGTGVMGILGGVGKALLSMARTFGPIALGAGAVVGVVALMTKNINDATNAGVTMGDTFQATVQVMSEGIWRVLQPAIAAIAPLAIDVFNAVIDAAIWMGNKVVGVFVFSYESAVSAWKMLPKTVGDVVLSTVNVVINLVEGMINRVIDAVNWLIRQVNKVGALVDRTLTEVNQVTLGGVNNPFQGAANDFARSLADNAKEAFSEDYLGDLFQTIQGRAVEIARKRQAKEFAESDVGKATASLFQDSKAAIQALKDEATVLDRSITIYGDYGQKVSAATQYLNLVAQARKDSIPITQTLIDKLVLEAEAYGKASSEVEKLRRQQDMWRTINEDVINYTQSMETLVQLLEAGAINQGQFNQAVGGLSLNQKLRDVDTSLGGTAEGQGFADTSRMEEVRIAEQERLNVVKQAAEARIITEAEAADRIRAINKQATDDIKSISQERQSQILTDAQAIGDGLTTISGAIFGEQSKAQKVAFAAAKAFAIADSLLKIQQGMANALSIPFPANLGALAAVAAQGASIVTNIKAVASNGFRVGGYTGAGNDNDAAGTAHKGEFYFSAPETRRIGVGNLEHFRRTGSLPDNGAQRPNVNVQPRINIVNNAPGVEFETREMSEGDIEVIAERIAKKTVKNETPRVVSGELSKPNSRTSQSMGGNFRVERKR